MGYSNKGRIVNYILQEGTTSKISISKSLELSWPTVLQYTNELLEQGMLIEQGEYKSTGGRKAKMISLNPSYAYSAGINITKNHVGFVVIDFQGNVLSTERKRKQFQDNTEYYEWISKALDSFLKTNGIDSDQLLGTGIAIPALLNETQDRIVLSAALSVSDVGLDKIGRHINTRIMYENDAKAALIAEIDTIKENAVLLSLSNTVGGAIFYDGKLNRGSSFMAGEFGHMIIKAGGRKCYCGSKGCVDAYCSALRLSKYTNGNLDLFFDKLKQKDPDTSKIWDEYLDHLAIAVKNLCVAFDCKIILGGYVGPYLSDYLDDLKRKMEAFAWNTYPYLQVCTHRREAAGVGAATMFIKKTISEL